MASAEQQMLKSLQAIESHVKTSAGNSSKIIADNATGEGNAFEQSNLGLIKAFSQMQKAIKANQKAFADSSREAARLNVQNRHANKALKELHEEVEKQIQGRKDARAIHRSVNKQLEKLNDMGIDLRTTFALTGNQTKDQLLPAIMKATEGLNAEADAHKKSAKAVEKDTEARKRAWEQQKEALKDDFWKGVAGSISVAVTRSSQAMISAGGTGFQFAGGAGGGQGIMGSLDTLGGVFDAGVEAFSSGASIEEIQAFAGANRAALTAAVNASTGTTSAMLTAQEGIASVENYGDSLRDTFGFRGADQLNAIGQSLTILTNLGVAPLEENLMAMGQAVEDVTKTSNASANEIFAEFQNLAEDSDFQAFFLAMGNNVGPAEYLAETFLNLQKTVGLNLKEFVAYQKFLAQQRQRTGSERAVQAGFAATLGGAMGLSQEDTDLLSRGTAFRESLGEDEGARFDILFNQLGKDLADERMRLAAAGDIQGLENIDILRQGAGIPEQIAAIGRDASGVNQAQQAAQDERLKASASQTESLVTLNNTVREMVDGFIKSPIAGVGFFGEMTTAIFKGTLAANLASGGGKGLGVAGKLLGKAGILGAVGYGAFELGNYLGLDDVGSAAGSAAAELFGAGKPSDHQLRIRAMEDDLLEKQVAMGKQAEELNQQRAEAATNENQAMIDKLDEQLTILRDQYNVMTEKEEEAILAAKSNPGRNPRGKNRNR